MPGQDGWPTLADVHEQVTGMRAELQETCAELRHQRQELEQHRADDRRELDDLHHQVRGLARRWWGVAGGLAVVAAAAPVVTRIATGG